MYDTGLEVIRETGNSSDKDLVITKFSDIPACLAKMPLCNTIATTGKKSTEALFSILNITGRFPKIGQCKEFEFMERKMNFYQMPSSSRAYPKPLEEKAKIYEQMFREIKLLR